jgi:hypothetical protein
MRGSAYFRDLVDAAIRRRGLEPTTSVLDGLEAALAFVDVAWGDDGPKLVGSVGGLFLPVR